MLHRLLPILHDNRPSQIIIAGSHAYPSRNTFSVAPYVNALHNKLYRIDDDYFMRTDTFLFRIIQFGASNAKFIKHVLDENLNSHCQIKLEKSEEYVFTRIVIKFIVHETIKIKKETDSTLLTFTLLATPLRKLVTDYCVNFNVSNVEQTPGLIKEINSIKDPELYTHTIDELQWLSNEHLSAIAFKMPQEAYLIISNPSLRRKFLHDIAVIPEVRLRSLIESNHNPGLLKYVLEDNELRQLLFKTEEKFHVLSSRCLFAANLFLEKMKNNYVNYPDIMDLLHKAETEFNFKSNPFPDPVTYFVTKGACVRM